MQSVLGLDVLTVLLIAETRPAQDFFCPILLLLVRTIDGSSCEDETNTSQEQ